jgi:hypothetical protein
MMAVSKCLRPKPRYPQLDLACLRLQLALVVAGPREIGIKAVSAAARNAAHRGSAATYR